MTGEMYLGQQQEQKLVLTQSMRESLQMLQMPLTDLRSYVLDKVLSNPLLDLDKFTEDMSGMLAEVGEHFRDSRQADRRQEYRTALRYAEETEGHTDWQGFRRVPEDGDYTIDAYGWTEESLTDHLMDQLRSVRGLSERQSALCEHLIFCLNDKGYLDCELFEISEELRVSYFEMQDALTLLQSFEPVGVGARNLKECLRLQLRADGTLDRLTEGVVQNGLRLLSRNNIEGLASMLGCSLKDARRAADTVRALEPVPARGFSDGRKIPYLIPEASVYVEDGTLVLEMNRRLLPKIRFNEETVSLLQSSRDQACEEYLQKNTQDARSMMRNIDNRGRTIERLLNAIIERQSGFFLRGEPLQPMKMGDLAEELNVNRSTISRAIHGKSILFEGRDILLKEFFTNSLLNMEGENVSTDSIKKQIAAMICRENPNRPLSDEKIRRQLSAMNILASRRTVSKYREEIGIACSSVRRRRGMATAAV